MVVSAGEKEWGRVDGFRIDLADSGIIGSVPSCVALVIPQVDHGPKCDSLVKERAGRQEGSGLACQPLEGAQTGSLSRVSKPLVSKHQKDRGWYRWHKLCILGLCGQESLVHLFLPAVILGCALFASVIWSNADTLDRTFPGTLKQAESSSSSDCPPGLHRALHVKGSGGMHL